MLRFYKEHLANIYDEDEIEELCFIAFNHVMKLSKSDFRNALENRINQSELIIIYDIAKALASHKPIQYIINSAHFYGLDFFVNEQVLIPRQETEELVALVLDQYSKEKNKDITMLDIGTGSGCIAISIKKNAPQASVTAIDISAGALDIAKRNAEKNKTAIPFIEADILSGDALYGLKFDYIVSNPPYIAKSESDEMAENVLAFEPHLALFTEDPDPLVFYKRISALAGKHLNKGGKLFFEINQRFGNEVKEIMEMNHFNNVIIQKDINNNDRIIWGVLV